MNNKTPVFNGDINNITENNILFGINSEILRKVMIDNIPYLYTLTQHEFNYQWEMMNYSIYHTNMHFGAMIENINHIFYTSESLKLENGETHNYMMLYKTNESNTLTHTMILKPNEAPEWVELASEMNLHLVNKYITSRSIKDIPTHCNFTAVNDNIPCDTIHIEKEDIQGWNDNKCDVDYLMNNTIIHTQASSEEDDNSSIDDIVKKYQEYRVDPYDNEWYTEEEFYNYYGGYEEWNFQEPRKILIREKIKEFTDEYRDLENEKFIFLYQKIELTF